MKFLPDTCYVQLGRIGDIINILPLMKNALGKKTPLMVAKDYFQLLEGCSYVEPVLWNGDFADLRGALAWGRGFFREFKVTQVYAHGMNFPRKTESFIKESYNQVNRLQDFGRLPLVFDRRDYNREKELVHRFKGYRPLILVAPHGHSSPFPHGFLMMDLLRSAFESEFDILDLSRIKAERFYDLLALYDVADCLVTIDTAHMHLARGSKVPTVALVTDGPTPWHSTAPLTGQIMRMKYSEFVDRKEEMLAVIRAVCGKRVPETNLSGRRIFHVYSNYPRGGDAAARHAFARKTWEVEYDRAAWKEVPISNEMLGRSSKSVFADTREMPFIRDLVDGAIKQQRISDSDVIILTNDDICFAAGLTESLLKVLPEKAAWANRWDFKELKTALTPAQICRGSWCSGTDLFAFTRSWWEKHREVLPDMVLGCEAWDWLLREIVMKSGGFEIHTMIYHQFHNSFWYVGRNRSHNPGNVWNRRLAKIWLQDRNMPIKELAWNP